MFVMKVAFCVCLFADHFSIETGQIKPGKQSLFFFEFDRNHVPNGILFVDSTRNIAITNVVIIAYEIQVF